MVKFKKNKIIIIGKSGTGKSQLALELGLKKLGTTIICNGSVDKSYYEKMFQNLKEFENKDGSYTFTPEKNRKYYIRTDNCKSAIGFVNALIRGCDYETLGTDKKATIIYDDNAWGDSENNMLTLWQLSHTDCKIIITAESLCDVLKIDESELTEEMIKDVSKYWDIVRLVKINKIYS